MITHANEHFRDQTVFVSGKMFHDCTFEKCTLVITSWEFHMAGETEIQECNWRLEVDIIWRQEQMIAVLEKITAMIARLSRDPAQTTLEDIDPGGVTNV